MTTTIQTSLLSMADALEREVSSAVNFFHTSLIEADKDGLEALLSGSLSYGHSNGAIENKQQFIENIMNGNSVFIEIEVMEQTIKTEGDFAIVRHIFKAKTNDSNISSTVSLRILLVWKKQNKKWKLLARQAVKA